MNALIRLDLSASFHATGHLMLLKCLKVSFGIKERVLTWLKSNLADRTQCVSVADKTSPDVDLNFGIPKGSVLGPRNYSMYNKSVTQIIKATSNISFVPATLASCKFQITVQYPVSHIQSTE